MGFPPEVEATSAQLPADLRDSFQRDFVQRRKSIAVAFLLWALVGAHYAYLRQRRQQLLFVFSLGGLGIWWAVDAVRIPRLVERVNSDIARSLVAQYRALAFAVPGVGRSTATSLTAAAPVRRKDPVSTR